MHSINDELKGLNQKMDKLIGMFDDSKLAKLHSIYSFFTETMSEFSSNLLNFKQINSRYDEVVHRKIECKELADFYERQLNRIVNGFSNTSDNLKSFESALNDFYKNMGCYEFAIELYGIANFVEVVLCENHDDKYLKTRINDLKQYSKNCCTNVEKWYENTESWILEAKALNGEEWMGYVPIVNIFYVVDEVCKAKKKHPLLSNLYSSFDQYTEGEYKFYNGVNALIKYSNQIGLIQNKEFNMYYHNGDMYIEKNDLEVEEK